MFMHSPVSAAAQDDGVNLEEWYQWLAAFTGLLCKKHGWGLAGRGACPARLPCGPPSCGSPLIVSHEGFRCAAAPRWRWSACCSMLRTS